jgi:CrcB protein
LSEPHGDLPVDSDVPEQSSRKAHQRAARVFRERWDVLLVIAAGGALGSLARWWVNEMIPHAPDGVPWATAVENVTGGLVLGALMVLILDYWPPHRYLRPFVGVGLLGGYTTFSTYMLDTRNLMAAGRVPAAAGYLFGTLLAGLVGVGLGVLAARFGVATAERRHQQRRDRQHRARPAPSGHRHDSGQNPDPDTDRDTASRSRR